MVLGMAGVGFAACLWRFLRSMISPPWGIVMAASLLLAGASHYTRGIRTPGYDWTILVGSMVFCSGWLWLEASQGGVWPMAAQFLTAVGCVVLAAGKWLVLPGYALLLGCLIWGKFPSGQRGPAVRRIGAWIFVLAALFLIEVGRPGLQDTWRAGVIYSGSSDRERILAMYLGWLAGYVWVLLRAMIWVTALYGLVWGLARAARRKNPPPAAVGSVVFILALGLALLRGHGQGGFQSWGKASMLMGVWLLGVGAVAGPRLSFPATARQAWARPTVRVFFLLIAVPLLNAIGTITGLTNYLAHGAIFFVAAGWLLLVRSMDRGLPTFCALAALFSIGTLQAARVATTPEDVMRVGKVCQADEPVRTGPETGKLCLHASSVDALAQIDAVFQRSGFRPGDPVVGWWDLCGLVYLLGGISPGCSWYLGGVSNHLANLPPGLLEKSWFLLREGVDTPAMMWPSGSSVNLPVRVEECLSWPEGDGAGVLRPLHLYRPACRIGQNP